jgi:hypothetical protein
MQVKCSRAVAGSVSGRWRRWAGEEEMMKHKMLRTNLGSQKEIDYGL